MSDVAAGMGGEPQRFYFCLAHHAVEGPAGCRGEVRLGPYETYEQAAAALETARQRTQEWDADDDAWEGSGAQG